MKFWQVLGGFVLALLLAGCVSTTDKNTVGEPEVAAENLAVTGSVLYRERIALPPEAMVSIVLADASEVGVPANVLSQVSFPAAGKQVPFNFSLPYAQEQVKDAKRIIVSARIDSNGKAMFTTSRLYEVIVNGKTSDIQVMLERVLTEG